MKIYIVKAMNCYDETEVLHYYDDEKKAQTRVSEIVDTWRAGKDFNGLAFDDVDIEEYDNPENEYDAWDDLVWYEEAELE